MPPTRDILWFERLFGFEEFFDKVKSQLKCEEESGLCYLTGPNNKRYCAGRFEYVSVSDLLERASVDNTVRDNKRSKMEIVTGDVVKFINQSKNNGTVFHVASQFNCLEFVNPAITPEAGVERYEYDHTQGPACSVACGPATVHRNYFIDMPGEPEQKGQTEGRQLDGFEDVAALVGNTDEIYFKQKNGYLTATPDQLKKFNDRLDELAGEHGWDSEDKVFDGAWSKLKIGVHYEAEVTSSEWGKKLSETPNHRITQVFGSAAAMGYCRGFIDRGLWTKLACGILDASYMGLFAVAALNPTKTVYVTFIGGGVFQNSMTWICAAIEKAALRFRDSGLKIYIVCYGQVPENVRLMAQRYNPRK